MFHERWIYSLNSDPNANTSYPGFLYACKELPTSCDPSSSGTSLPDRRGPPGCLVGGPEVAPELPEGGGARSAPGLVLDIASSDLSVAISEVARWSLCSNSAPL